MTSATPLKEAVSIFVVCCPDPRRTCVGSDNIDLIDGPALARPHVKILVQGNYFQ